ncbi:MAG: helix-hairpin-helix domain-containing protein [Planctomycetes bacterium]|nr:helix-hairpin-helix domain-containing protein [Planctomycetota bacterium]
MTAPTPGLAGRLARELGAPERAVAAAIALFDEGRTLAFVARYRKEQIRGLDEEGLRRLALGLERERRLDERRAGILAKLEERGADPAVLAAVAAAGSLAELEEIWAPWKSSRKTKADLARAAGLDRLAEALVDPRRRGDADELTREFAPTGSDHDEALAGAIEILIDRLRKDTTLRPPLLEILRRGRLTAKRKRGFDGQDRRFDELMDQAFPLDRLPGHRLLALQRGEEAGALSLTIDFDLRAATQAVARGLAPVALLRAHPELRAAVERALDKHLAPSIERELLAERRGLAEREAAEVFARNLRALLLAAPAGPRPVLALDPGFRAGCKIAALDRVGEVVETTIIHPTEPRRDEEGSTRRLVELIRRHRIELLALGNGQGSRETMAFLRARLLPALAEAGLDRPEIVLVSEAGASVWSASAEAAAELPDLDLSLRGAVSIGRRLQDPLAELVKIEPRSLGVGQYQHDVDPKLLEASLDRELECAVAAVGVDLRTASSALLARVPGLGPRLATTIVERRAAQGPPRSREELRTIKGLGPVAFENCAGFLRIKGEEALDRSGIHPESYPLVDAIAALRGLDRSSLLGRRIELDDAERADLAAFGAETVADVLRELAEPGRDPRAEFRNVRFREDVTTIGDLEPGMHLEGVVTNATDFGLFCDLGVDKDGLLHHSRLRGRPAPGPGAILRLVVLEVDQDRGRIALDLENRP